MEEIESEDEEFIQELLPQIVSRKEWGAKDSRRRKALKTPVKKIVFTTTNDHRCFSKAHCKHNLKVYQNTSFDDSRNDIPYNFLIGSDGRVYEGMGWDYQADYTTYSWLPFFYNPMSELYETCLHVAFMNFKRTKPSPKQVKAAFGLLVMGIKNKILNDNVDIIESKVRGPLFPQEAFNQEDNDESLDEDGKKDIPKEQLLALINEDVDDDDKITMEQMEEELKDIDKKFKEFDEKLKIECQEKIDKYYPWHTKSKTENKNND